VRRVVVRKRREIATPVTKTIGLLLFSVEQIISLFLERANIVLALLLSDLVHYAQV
jgi:hypothetical protein